MTGYAEVFKTVCVDAAYYQFPSEKYLAGLTSQVPGDFRFTFKVTDNTLKRFTNLPRFGIKAGKPNEHILNAELFIGAFLKPCEPFRQQVGLLMFEFSRFYSSDYAHGRDFVADLDRFLGQLPAGWNYGVELRNQDWLQPEYSSVLRKHGVVHVFNNWSVMPTVGEQIALPGSDTSDSMVAARFLLKPGRKYDEAVKEFSAYKAVKEINAEARKAGGKLIGVAKSKGKQAFIYVNNRLEGNAECAGNDQCDPRRTRRLRRSERSGRSAQTLPHRVQVGIGDPHPPHSLRVNRHGSLEPLFRFGHEPLAQFLTRVRAIERETGLDFCPELSKEVQDRIETVQAERLW